MISRQFCSVCGRQLTPEELLDDIGVCEDCYASMDEEDAELTREAKR